MAFKYSHKVYAIIPARRGSKGVPRKNVRPLLDKPLIAWTIEAARKARGVDRVIVLSDDDETHAVALKYGAEVPVREPVELAQDLTPVEYAFRFLLTWLHEHEGEVADVTVNLAPTSPLREGKDIEQALSVLKRYPEADSVRSVMIAPKHPLKMWRLEHDRLQPFMSHPELPGAFNLARQHLHAKMPVYCNNGAIDAIRTRVILEGGSLSGKIIYGFEMDERKSVNIDSVVDFYAAEAMLRERLKQ